MVQRLFVAGILFVVGSVIVSQAANINKALADAEGRRRAAENGLREIKAQSQGDQVRAAYMEAASRQNGWLDIVCQAVEQPAPTAPDVSSAAQTAASSLIEWVTVRNKALGQPELTGTVADANKTSITRNLTEIAAEMWKDNRNANEQKRTKAITDLRSRLQWKAFEQVQ
jgi:hypothetical protein